MKHNVRNIVLNFSLRKNFKRLGTLFHHDRLSIVMYLIQRVKQLTILSFMHDKFCDCSFCTRYFLMYFQYFLLDINTDYTNVIWKPFDTMCGRFFESIKPSNNYFYNLVILISCSAHLYASCILDCFKYLTEYEPVYDVQKNKGRWKYNS